jgi:hypothetical protein
MESFIAESKDFAENIGENTPPVVGPDGRTPVAMNMAAKNPTWNIDPFD